MMFKLYLHACTVFFYFPHHLCEDLLLQIIACIVNLISTYILFTLTHIRSLILFSGMIILESKCSEKLLCNLMHNYFNTLSFINEFSLYEMNFLFFLFYEIQGFCGLRKLKRKRQWIKNIIL